MRGRPAIPTCSFCGQPKAEVELLFCSEHGGDPPAICDGCVGQFSEVVRLHRESPQLSAALVEAVNMAVGR